jgi:lysozyme
MLKGIDVSHHQGSIKWDKVTADFAFVKATEGEKFVDHLFKTNWAGAHIKGIPIGAYHFFHPDQDAGIQAKRFCDTLLSVPGKRLPPVLDIEQTGGISQALILVKVRKWLDYVEKATGQKPIIYSYVSFLKQVRLGKTFSAYPLWIAHYRAATPAIAGLGWNDWKFWQYNDRGKIPGIAGNVDVNYFKGTAEVEELKSLLR